MNQKTWSGEGPVEVRYALEPESLEYNVVSALWNVTFNMTVSITNRDPASSATIDTVDVAVWPSFEKGHQKFGTIYETMSFYQSLAPGQSATKRMTFSHTFTDAELSAFADRDYEIIITVPGYRTTAESMMEGTGDTRVYPPLGVRKTLTVPSPSPAPFPSGPGVPATSTWVAPTLPASPHVPGGLLVWYDFEENFASTGRVRDRSGNGNDAIQNGNIRIAPGIVGKQAILFDGSGYILAKNNPASGRKNVTFSFWFKTENPDNNYKMASAAWWRGGPGSGWTMATHIPEFWAEDTKGVCLSDISNLDNKFLRGQWNFEVVTYDGQRIREYTNGKLINTWQTRGVPLGAGSPMAIGGWPEVGFFYSGAIDEFIIYDHCLTAQEISVLHSRSPS